MEMTAAEKQLFEDTYVKVFLKFQEKRGRHTPLNGLMSWDDQDDMKAAREVAERTVYSLRLVMADQAAEPPKPSRPDGGFEHL